MNFLLSVFAWVQSRFRAARWWLKIIYGAIVAGVGVGLVWTAANINFLQNLFNSLSDFWKVAVMLVMFGGVLIFALWSFAEVKRNDQLAADNARLGAELEAAQEQVTQHEARMAQLVDVETRSRLWQRQPGAAPIFLPSAQRKTRFVTVLNLKGGVGKTTLAANLAACLGMDPNPLRVLLVDVDFQGTLGVATVDDQLRQIQELNGHFVHRLLTTEVSDDDTLRRLRIGMSGVPNVQVVLSADSLEQEEFQLQARYFLDPARDPRFRFRTHLQRQAVTDAFDLVVFDCPPRVTASVVNALLCSDFVLIPTRLDAGSMDAVPRTIHWVKSFGPLYQGSGLGVVATHVSTQKGSLIRTNQLSYDRLREAVQSSYGTDVLFREVVRTTPDALNPRPGVVASATARGRAVFAAFVAEFRRRMSL